MMVKTAFRCAHTVRSLDWCGGLNAMIRASETEGGSHLVVRYRLRLLGEESLVLLLGLDEALLEEVGVLGVTETDGKSSSLRLALRDIGGGIPDPAAVAADVGGELHVGNN
jgi:hypothetical protein